MTNACPSTLTAPFLGEDAEHQCSYGKAGHEGDHYCGCGYQWNDAQVIVIQAPPIVTETHYGREKMRPPREEGDRHGP